MSHELATRNYTDRDCVVVIIFVVVYFIQKELKLRRIRDFAMYPCQLHST